MQLKQVIAVRKALSLFKGNKAELARRVDVHPVVVGQWIKVGHPSARSISAKKCVLIERITGGVVLRQHLRPEDWREIWPELQPVPDLVDVDALCVSPPSPVNHNSQGSMP